MCVCVCERERGRKIEMEFLRAYEIEEEKNYLNGSRICVTKQQIRKCVGTLQE